MTTSQDLFVGGVAILFGGLLLAGAACDADVLMRLGKSQMLSERLGRGAARGVIAACGVAVIAMGGIIASGWRIAW
jgi:hypothetical protein